MKDISGHKVELLAPAGSMAALHAAVRAGADAVYLGAAQFNARAGADNFTLETLAQACDYAHLRGVKVYLTLNIVVLPSEVPDALELARQAYRAGVDAFIVQDIGLAQELARTMPAVELHISTQMNTHSEDGIRAAAALGAKRVTLARELSLEQISRLAACAQELGMEVEAFAHGALCVCYSGQCFMSSLVGGRSANRGRCAQACRLPYTLHNEALRNKDLPAPGEHLLSPKDLCTATILPEMIEAGVTSFKVEGRMKQPEYVQGVVGVYRAVMDRVLEWRWANLDAPCMVPDPPRPTPEELQTLEEVFSRGFTTAYLEGERGNEMMSYGRPNNRGVFVGRVAAVREGMVEVAAEVPLAKGDVLEFWTNRGHFAHTIDALDKQGGMVRLQVPRAVGKGDRVFRVRSAEAAFEDDELLPKIPVKGKVCLHIGQPLTCSFKVLGGEEGTASAGTPELANAGVPRLAAAGAPAEVTAEGPVVEAARTKAVTQEEVREHINRMGGTPFEIAMLEVELDEGVGIGFSALHKVRAQTAEALQEYMLQPWHTRELQKTPARAKAPAVKPSKCVVAAWATNPACARAAKKAGADAIYVPVLNYKRGEAVIAGQLSPTAEQAGYPNKCIPALPTVAFDEETPRTGKNAQQETTFDLYKRVGEGKPVLVENFGQALHAAAAGAQVEVGPHVPVTNALTLQTLATLGATRVWLSPELTLSQIQELGQESPVPLGLTIMGAQELMTTEHCLLMSQGPCNQDCASCARRRSPHHLKDRKGYEMPVVTDCMGRSHLYNAVQLDVAHAVPEIIQAGISALMVDTTMMNVAETTKAVARAVRARDIALRGAGAVSRAGNTTTGHLFRGVK